MDELRDRIAAAVVVKLSKRRDGRVEFSPYDVADAVIAELGLTQEWLERPHSDERDYRYFTDWRPVDE